MTFFFALAGQGGVRGDVHPLRLVVLIAAALALSWGLRGRRVQSLWPYVLLPGALSWAALYTGGVHPALALVPIAPWMPHARHDHALIAPAVEPGRDTLNRSGRWWHTPVQVILFLFGLVNAGVSLAAVGAGTWLVLFAIVAGKPIGIVLATGAATLSGLHRPAHVTWVDLVIVGGAAGIGFTVALFFATAAFADGALLDQAKMGALLSIAAAALAFVVAAFRRPSRSHRDAASR